MKRIVFSAFSIAMVASLMLTACKKEIPPDTEPDYEKANLAGNVLLFDQAKNAETPQKMFVLIEGNSFATYAETDKQGAFLLQNVPFYDNYTLSYIKDGYGTYKIFNFNHQYTGSAGTVGSTPKLGMKSTSCVTSLTVVNDTTMPDTLVQFRVTVSAGNVTSENPAYVRFFFHEIDAVSDSTFTNYSPHIPIQTKTADIYFSPSDFLEFGLQSGASYFVKAYGDSYYSNVYFDFVKSREVFPNLCTVNSPGALEIVVP